MNGGVLSGDVDVSRIHQQSVFARSLLLEFEGENAYGWSPVIDALLGVGSEHACASQGVNLCGGDGGKLMHRWVVVEIDGIWVCCPCWVMSMGQCG